MQHGAVLSETERAQHRAFRVVRIAQQRETGIGVGRHHDSVIFLCFPVFQVDARALGVAIDRNYRR